MKMNVFTISAAVTLVAGFVSPLHADENHEIIEKIMKEGFKGESSYFGKVKEGTATLEDYTSLYELARGLRGTTAPIGDQAAYDEKVQALILAAGGLAYAEASEERISALKTASNCKACHSEHKPD